LKSKVKKRTSALAVLEELRLLVAAEIICYAVNTRDDRAHISPDEAVSELFDQYCLKIFLNWLAYKHRFPVCANAIQPPNQAPFRILDCWQSMANRYPFYSYFPEEVEKRAAAAAFEYLDRHLEADLQLAGVLYMRTMTSSVAVSPDCKPYIEKIGNGRRGGEFYTPNHLARRCIQEPFAQDSLALINELKRNSNGGEGTYRLLDPACGSGNFLLAALDLFRENLRQHGLSLQHLTRFASDCLYGHDIDMRAVAIAHALIAISLSQELCLSREHLAAGEFESCLSDLMDKLRTHVSCSDAVSNATSISAQFNFVVTNPPYISYGARNQPPLHAGVARYLRHNFAASAEYKIRLHSVFQELCVRMSIPGGNIVMLVPDAFLSGAFYAKLRRMLLENCRIVSLTELPESAFPDAVAGRWCIAHYRKRIEIAPPVQRSDLASAVATSDLASPNQRSDLGSSAQRSDLASLAQSRDLGSPANYSVRLQRVLRFDQEQCLGAVAATPAEVVFDVPLSRLVSRDKSRFQLVFNEQDAYLTEKFADLPLVSSVFHGHTGMRSRLGQVAIIADKPGRGGNWCRGIVSGGNVVSHRVNWTGKWLDVSPEKLFAGGFDSDVIEGPKLLIRQTADCLIGGVDEDGLYHLNNVHSFALRKNSPAARDVTRPRRLSLVLFLDGLVNSTLWLYLYQLKSREQRRALAQIDIEMVESMPLPAELPAADHPVGILVTKLKRACDSPLAAHDEQINRAIDRLVFDLYKLSPSEVDHIEAVTAISRSTRSNLSRMPLPSRSDACKLVEFCMEDRN
jgi:adenine-specific DNA-methyltransferase